MGLMVGGITPEGLPIGPVQDLTVAVDEPGAWKIANQTLDRTGQVQSELPVVGRPLRPRKRRAHGRSPVRARGVGRVLQARCTTRATGSGSRSCRRAATGRCRRSRAAIFLALAGLLAAGSFWWLRHRVV